MKKAPQTIYDYLCAYALEQPEHRLLGDRQGWLTAGETLARVEQLAGKLWKLGLRQNTPAALRMSQNKEAVLCLLALQAVGALTVLAGARCRVKDALTETTLPELPEFLLSDESGEWRLERRGGSYPLERVSSGTFSLCTKGDEPAIIIFTSGSTGAGKGVMLSQQNLIANLLDSAPLGGYRRDDIALGALPFDHVFGLALLTGAIVLQHSLYIAQGSDLPTVLETIQTQRITRMNGVPTLYLNLAAHTSVCDLSSLRCGFIGGGPCTADQFEKIELALGMTLIPVYGMSECVGISCGSWQDSRQVRARGAGRIYPMNQCRIVRENGAVAQIGEVGEICVRGPMRMLGYCDKEQTAQAVDREGFLYTGDLGFLDGDGILHLTGRKKDVIIRNGITLSARRIEEALLGVLGVRDAVVVPLPHATQGEAPWAMVCANQTAPELLEALAQKLPKNELPISICVAESIPMTPSGKPDKEKVKELLARWAAV